MELLSGIVADGVIDIEEFRILDQWLMWNRDLSREFPFNVLVTQLCKILEDGFGVQDLERLQDLALEILHPESLGRMDLDAISETPLTQPPPRICFSGRQFVFTGNFYFGKKAQCERATSDQGGTFKDTVTHATDYVVVGGKGSPDWIHGNYGSKIEKAVSNIRNGATTAVISEAHWFDVLRVAATKAKPVLQSK